MSQPNIYSVDGTLCDSLLFDNMAHHLSSKVAIKEVCDASCQEDASCEEWSSVIATTEPDCKPQIDSARTSLKGF